MNKNLKLFLVLCSVVIVAVKGDEYSPVGRPNIPNPDDTFNPSGSGTFDATEFLAWFKGRRGTQGSPTLYTVGVKPGNYNVVGTLPIVFQSIYNFTIWMDGVTLTFPDNTKSAFAYEQAGPAAIRGLTMTFASKASHVASVTAVDKANNKITLQVSAGYNISKFAPVNNEVNHFESDGRMFASPYIGRLYPVEFSQVDATTFTYTLISGQVNSVSVGDLLGVPNARGLEQTKNLPAFKIANSEAVGFVDLTISNVAGIVFSERGGLGNHYYTRVKVTRGPVPQGSTIAPVLSTTGPWVIQSIGTQSGTVISYSLFENVENDVIFVTGSRAKISSANGNTVTVDAVPSEWVKGNRVRLYDTNARLVSTQTISSISGNTITLTSSQNAAYLASETFASSGFQMTYSTVRYCGGIALTLGAPNSLLSDNIFNATVAAGIYVGPAWESAGAIDDSFYSITWADYASNSVIQRNLFNSAGYSALSYGFGAITVQAFIGSGNGNKVSAGGFQSISILNNTISKTNSNAAISVSSTETLTVKGNNIVAPQGSTTVINFERNYQTTVDSNCVYLSSSDNVFFKLDGTATANAGVKDCTGQPNPNAPATSGTPSFPSRTDTPPTGIYGSSSTGNEITRGTGTDYTGPGGSGGGGSGSSPSSSNTGNVNTFTYTGNTVPPPTITVDESGRITTTNPATPDASGFYPRTDQPGTTRLVGGSSSNVASLLLIVLAMMLM